MPVPVRVTRPLIVATAMLLSASPISATDLNSADSKCSYLDIPQSPIATQLRELALQPGVKIEPATFMKDPQVADFIGQLAKQEQSRKQLDWAGLCRYRIENAAQLARGNPQVVFLGDSITENWHFGDPAFFNDKVINRGISGQTTSQILLRFYPDVVALHPAIVHLMAGTNDILQNTGVVSDDDIVNNISAMIDIAQINQVKVLLASILPISVRSWQPDVKPAPRLIQLNERLRKLATTRGIVFVDYWTSLQDAEDGLSKEFGNDGVHPNRAGYAVMRPIAARAVAQALR